MNLDTRNFKHSTKTANIHFDNHYLTEDEEMMVVHVEKIMTCMLMSINKETYPEVSYAVISCRNTGNDGDKPTIKVLDNFYVEIKNS